MTFTVVLVAAMAPGFFWLWFFLRGVRYRPNPRRLILNTFFLGMVSTIPAAAVEALLVRGDRPELTIGTAASVMFLVVGPVEELSKFLAVRLGAYRSLHFDEPLDGLEFSLAASLGFATAENIFYAAQYGPAVMLARGPFSTLAHVVFGSFWGMALALRRQDGSLPMWMSLGVVNKRRIIFAGLASATAAHGLFNFALVTGYWPIALVIVVAGAFWVARLFRWGRAVSPFRLRRNVPRLSCSGCGEEYRLGSAFCASCGTRVPGDLVAITCSNCGAVNRSEARYCTSCGDMFVALR